jgi:hypothetical protein
MPRSRRGARSGGGVTGTSNGSVSVAETGIVETSITGLGKGTSAVTSYSLRGRRPASTGWRRRSTPLVAVERDRVLDSHGLCGLADVLDVAIMSDICGVPEFSASQ